jgi:hypothetical protein
MVITFIYFSYFVQIETDETAKDQEENPETLFCESAIVGENK